MAEHREIRWEDYVRSSRELLTKPIAALEKIVIYRGSPGKLIPPVGWRKQTRSTLESLNINYRINSPIEQDIPYIDRSLPQIEQDKQTQLYFWGGKQFRMEIHSSEDFGKTWNLENIAPIKKPTGYPINNANILRMLTPDKFPVNPQTMLAISFRDVGHGVPQFGQDFFTCRVVTKLEELIYEHTPYVSPTITSQINTDRSPASNVAFKSIVPTRAGRKRLIFRVISGSTTVQTVVKYGAVADTNVATVTLTGAAVVAGLNGYEGEISFSQNTTFNTFFEVQEYFTEN